MKAASSSEWYDTTTSRRHLLPHLQHHQHPSTSSVSSTTSSSLPQLSPRHQHHFQYQQQSASFHTDTSFSSSSTPRYGAPPSLKVASTSGDYSTSFSSSPGTFVNTNCTNLYNQHRHLKKRPQRQVSKVVTPTITSISSTSFSKSYSRSSRSLSNNSTEPTATATGTSSTKQTGSSFNTSSDNNKLPYSFSPDAKKSLFLSSVSSSSQERQNSLSSSNCNQLFPGSSGTSFTIGNKVPSTPNTSFPSISETETEEASEDTSVESAEEEEEEEGPEEGTEDHYDDEEEDEEEEDQIYQSFKQSVRMLGSESQQPVQRYSPAVSLQSVVTELETEEENIPPESVDDDATSYTTEEDEEEEEEGTDATSSDNTTSVSTVHSRSSSNRSRSVPKTPVKVRVKVEKAVPQVKFDDRVKVTVLFEEEEDTEVSWTEEYDDENDDGTEEDEEEEEESATESDATSTNTVETVRYLRRESSMDSEQMETYGEESTAGESDQSEREMGSEKESVEDYENAVMTSTDKTDYPPPRRALMFPLISGIPRRQVPSENSMFLSSSSSNFGGNSMSFYAPIQQTTGSSTNNWGKTISLDASVDSTGTEPSGYTNSEVTNSQSLGSGSGTATATESSGSAVTASNSDLSSRSHSARSSLTGRANAIHKMYSVGGKVRSLSARRPPTNPPNLHASIPLLQLSSDSKSPSTSSENTTSTSDSKQYLPDLHLGSLAPPTMLSHSRSLSASSSSGQQFSAKLRQLSLGNIQAMNPPYPTSAARVLAERSFKGESLLPPITPPTPPSSSSTSSSQKPRPFLRNLTYTVCSHRSKENDDPTSSSSSGIPKLPPRQSTEHITLRQLITRDRTSSSSSSGDSDKSKENPEQLDDLLFPSNAVNEKAEKPPPSLSTTKPPVQVSFATNVIEHSLSASNTLESASTDHTGSGSTQQTDSISEESSESSWVTCRLTGRRMKRLTAEQEIDLLNKEYLTLQEIEQESIDEPDYSKERLRHFALSTIRQEMEMERRRIESMTEPEDEIYFDDYEFSDEEGSGSTEDSSEDDGEDDEDKETPKPWNLETSHIPVATSDAVLPETGSGEGVGANGDGSEVVETKPEGGKVPAEGATKDHSQSLSDGATSVSKEGEGPVQSSWKEGLRKSVDKEDEKEEEEIISLIPTRINSAESGYRAMPPSRAASSRENSLDPEEMEKEKERLMQQWKDSGGAGAPPAITTSVNSTSSQMVYGGELITINYSRPNTASDVNSHDALIQNGIDLTMELPGEEKKLAVVWEEFNRDEREGGAMADYEFSTLLDEMIMDVNSYKPKLSTTGLAQSNDSQSHSLQVSTQVTSSWEQPKFDPSRKYTTLSELVSLLSHNLRLVSSETLEDHMASLISLISSVLRKVRKNKTEDDYVTQIACLSAIRVLCDRLQEMTSSQNLKYADLSWLFRVLCKYSSDSESKIRQEASFCLARLVKVAGPALVVRPIYFILVMESEGGGGKTGTGAKTKAAAIDTLTYAMLTFAKEDFHNLEEIAGWVCLAMLNEERRIRQSALECLAIISQHLGGRDKALPLFHQLFLKEELDHFSRSPSPESYKTSKTGKSSKRGGKGSEPIPLSVHGTVRLLTGPGFPIAQPIDAITARLDKDVLPVPSTKGLIEYAVNVPTGKDLVLLMTHMLDKDDDEWDFSSSTDSLDSGSAHSKRSSVTSLGFSDIDWTGEGPEKNKNKEDTELISPDVAYILLGKGRVNKSDVVLLDTYKKEIIPEIIQMLNEKNKQGNNRRRNNRKCVWKNQKNKKRRRRKGRGQRRRAGDSEGRLIPQISFDQEEDTLPPHDNDDDSDHQGPHDESVDYRDGPVEVVVDPPDDTSKSGETPKTDT